MYGMRDVRGVSSTLYFSLSLSLSHSIHHLRNIVLIGSLWFTFPFLNAKSNSQNPNFFIPKLCRFYWIWILSMEVAEYYLEGKIVPSVNRTIMLICQFEELMLMQPTSLKSSL